MGAVTVQSTRLPIHMSMHLCPCLYGCLYASLYACVYACVYACLSGRPICRTTAVAGLPPGTDVCQQFWHLRAWRRRAPRGDVESGASIDNVSADDGVCKCLGPSDQRRSFGRSPSVCAETFLKVPWAGLRQQHRRLQQLRHLLFVPPNEHLRQSLLTRLDRGSIFNIFGA